MYTDRTREMERIRNQQVILHFSIDIYRSYRIVVSSSHFLLGGFILIDRNLFWIWARGRKKSYLLKILVKKNQNFHSVSDASEAFRCSLMVLEVASCICCTVVIVETFKY